MTARPGGVTVFVAALAALATFNIGLAADKVLDPAETSPSVYRQRLNDMVVTLMVGAPHATGLDVAYDIAGVLDDGATLRIVPIIGKKVAQNVRDVRFMRGVDLGLTHANILNHFVRTGELGSNIASQITYVAKLFNEEVHVLASSDVENIEDLRGKRVSFGEEGSGTDITAKLIFDALSIRVQPAYIRSTDVVRKITSGELDAAIIIGGKPAPMVSGLHQAKDLKLLSIPYGRELEDDYYPATFSHDDYPELIATDETVETVAVCAVLITFNWESGSERYRKIEKFVDAFFSKFEEFHEPPRHPKWHEVNLAATLENWTRSPIAQRWIDHARGGHLAASRDKFDEFLRQRPAPNDISMSETERAQLFRDFIEWNTEKQSSINDEDRN